MLCSAGDKVIAEWDTDTIDPDRLTEIETEFKEKMAAGWFAVYPRQAKRVDPRFRRQCGNLVDSESARWVDGRATVRGG